MAGTCAFRIVWICTVFRAAPALPTLYHAFSIPWALTTLLVGLSFLCIRPFATKRGAAESPIQQHGLSLHAFFS